MRHLVFALGTVFALAVSANPADAQIKFGAQAGLVTGLEEASPLDGTFGLGGRAMIDPPLLPVGGFVSATYFFPDNDVDYWTATAAAQLRLPLPAVKPYALLGWQLRGIDVGTQSETENGAVIGLGVQLDFMMSVFLEGTYEFNEDDPSFPDLDNDPFVITGGILFGGG